jgi:hypothetical protein
VVQIGTILLMTPPATPLSYVLLQAARPDSGPQGAKVRRYRLARARLDAQRAPRAPLATMPKDAVHA